MKLKLNAHEIESENLKSYHKFVQQSTKDFRYPSSEKLMSLYPQVLKGN